LPLARVTECFCHHAERGEKKGEEKLKKEEGGGK